MDPNKTHAEIGELAQRSPALRQREIPADVLDALSRGWIESKNLVEWLSVDRRILLGVLSVELNIDLSATLRALIEDREPLSPLQLSKRIAIELATIISPNDERFKSLEQHKSDVAREWGALIVGHWESMTFARRLAWIKPFAINPNPGTREIAWMALRAYVAQDPENAISKLIPWTGSRNDRMRRYASEITRPCGVWCTHIDRLKKEPHLGIEVLEPLRSDESLYVRNSVANWLNDASKYSPDWVLDITHRWERESPTEQTKYIVKRALRTLRKTNR